MQFATVRLRLLPTLFGAEEAAAAEWEAEVGFLQTGEPAWPVLLGQLGFFSHFTVTMHRAVPARAIEPYEAFDERFGSLIEQVDERQPRFQS